MVSLCRRFFTSLPTDDRGAPAVWLHGKDGRHDFHTPANGYLGQHKADEVPQGKLRPLQFLEGCRRGKDADRKEQHQQAVADPHQGRIDIDNDAPYRAALEGLRSLRDELPQLGQTVIPCGDCPFKISYDPIITDGLHLTFTKSFQKKIVRFYC